MMSSTIQQGPKHTDWRDEWDFLVSLGWKNSAHKSEFYKAITDRNGRPDPKTLDRWTRPNAGLLTPRNLDSPYELSDRILRWLRSSKGFDDAQITSARANYFKSFREFELESHQFIGRKAELDELRSKFSVECQSICLSSALYGIGGQGKTSIARQYLLEQQNDYAVTIWIDRRREPAREVLLRITQSMAPPTLDQKKIDALSLALLKLVVSFRGKMLLVIDDLPHENDGRAEREVDAICRAIPLHLRPRIHLLVTCRRTLVSAQNHIESVMVNRMNQEDSVALFWSRSNWTPDRGDDKAVAALVQGALGGHPLSITLVAAYARRNPSKSISDIQTEFESKLVDSERLNSIEVEDYKHNLYRSFRLSFDVVPRGAQRLLLILSLFRRARITLRTLRECFKAMAPDTDELREVHSDIAKARGTFRTINALVNYSLVEKIEVSKGMPQVRLHEVIYDFAQSEWVHLRKDVRASKWLDDIERSLAEGAARYASTAIDNDTIDFNDVETITGLLVPVVNVARNFIPSNERISIALEFWWDNFKFQDFVYATGLQDLLLTQLRPLVEYLRGKGDYLNCNPKHHIILNKLLGHAYYADPETGAEFAESSFRQAMRILETLDCSSLDEETRQQLPIYRIFFLDHATNIKSKVRMRPEIPVMQDKDLGPQLKEVEAMLPASLRQLTNRPEESDCRYLARAMHYWGHRGNQGSYTLLRLCELGRLNEDWEVLAEETFDSYLKALSFRMLAIRLFRLGQYNQHIAKLYQRGILGFYPEWVHTAEPISEGVEYEGFTSLAQAFGDTAHQYRGMHLVCVLHYIVARLNNKERDWHFARTRTAFASAAALWELSKVRRSNGETPVKFQVWMASSEILERLVETLESERELPMFKDARSQLERRVRELEAEVQAPYSFSVKSQIYEIETVWNMVCRFEQK